MAKRGFEGISVVATGVQSFDDRFPGGRRYTFDTPPISQWRCNLTALSQVHNLYFVAYGEHVYVYIPQFPKQQIKDQLKLGFTSLPSSPGLRGHIDPRSPHCINNLIVQFLGTEEVVAVVRDDGDVDAFLVRHIVQAIERRAEPGSTIGVGGDEIRPFYQSNVGDSAWGLAIHSEARILAVSSNAREVTVVKFGLLQLDEDEASAAEGEEVLPDANSPELNQANQRKTDVTHHVINGNANIPYIAFCNTGDDPEGRWLLTTDISGMCRVMDMQDMEAVQAFRFGRSCTTTRDFQGFDRVNAGWSIMFLDKRSFQVEDDLCVALGVEDESILKKPHRDGDQWDLSDSVLRFKESSEPFIYHQVQAPVGDDSSLRQAARAGDDAFTTTSSHARDESAERSESSDGGASINIENDVPEEMREEVYEQGMLDDAEDHEPGDHDEDDHNEEDSEAEDQSADDHEEVDGGIEVEMFEPVQEEGADDHGPGPRRESELRTGPYIRYSDSMYASPPRSVFDEDDDLDSDEGDGLDADESDSEPGEDDLIIVADDLDLIDDDFDPDDEGTEDTLSYTSFYNGNSIVGNDPRFKFPDKPLCDALPCPILHASVRNVYLLQPSSPGAAYKGPFLGFANPLRQKVHKQFEYLRMFERLNMSAYIQSLGVVILASQKGRLIVLSLTKVLPTARFPNEIGNWYHSTSSSYCMRAECILPFEHQEKANQRPYYPLHGIAVGPIQGSEGLKPEMRRWRLMMIYQDHSILSYEIGRRKKGGERDSGVDISSLVV